MAKFYRKSKGDTKITVSERGVSLHSGAVNMIYDNFGEPEYLLIGYEQETDSLLVKPVGKEDERDAFKVSGRVEKDKYLTVNSKSLSRFLEREIEGFDELIESGDSSTITGYGKWNDADRCIDAKIDRSELDSKEDDRE